VIYLDSSALLKMLIDERESEALALWFASRTDIPKVSSELARVEVIRACRRIDEDIVPGARRLLSGLDLVPVTSEVIEQAALAGDPTVRSLDAIHLASAMMLRSDLSAFVVYDRRLREAAEAEGLAVSGPA
jgi:predicted nucleic acid-binding protein